MRKRKVKIHFGCDGKGYEMYIMHPIPILDVNGKTNPYFFVCPNCGFKVINNKKRKGVVTITKF